MEYIFDDSSFSGTYTPEYYASADLHFNQIGNDFGGKIFFQDFKVVPLTQLEIGDETPRYCYKQLRGFYVNAARGNRVRPLDQDSLNYLKSVDSSYNYLTMSGWFFMCTGNTNAVIWWIEHLWAGESFSLIAGLEYDFDTNNYLHSFSDTGTFIFEDAHVTWYLWDTYGGIAEILWSGLNVVYACGDGITEGNEVCDDGPTNNTIGYCNTTCNGPTLSLYCGNSIIKSNEICDDDDTKSWAQMSIIPSSWNAIVSPYSKELTEAYQRAYGTGITSISPIQKANLMGTLLRAHAAKMISQFAINVLHKKPNDDLLCVFNDLFQESLEMQFYAKLACKLGLMGLKADGTPDVKFNPSGKITRAQFGTILSRLLYGNVYNNQPGQWYTAHLQALQKVKIITKISQPTMLELRGRVMVMMKRIASD